jgi:hypothetical protein
MIRSLPLDPCEPADAAPAAAVSGAIRAAAPGVLPAEWFRGHVQNLWRVVLRLGVPRHAIDDLVQETFIIATRRRADIGPGQERGFLVATAVRLSSNYRSARTCVERLARATASNTALHRIRMPSSS